MMIKFLIEKEFKQIFRNSFLPKMILAFPCMVMLVFPWAVNLEIKNINVAIVDWNRSMMSSRLVEKIGASDYFNLVEFSDSYDAAMKEIGTGKADVVIEIPSRFEEDLVREGNSRVMVAVNTVNGTKGGLGSSYLSSIISDFTTEINEERGGQPGGPAMSVSVQNRYNPHLDYKVFMIPGLMVMLLTLLCGFLPALNIVEEKEKGTIEQINVTPVRKFTFILAKLIPYWIMGFLILSICFILSWLIYGLVPAGSLLTIYIFAMLYVLVMSGFGLLVSNYSATMQQAMFVMFFFIIIMLLMSGLFTPVDSMPGWGRAVTAVNPLTYFIRVMRQVYLKGSTFIELLRPFWVLSVFALVFNTWAILSYRKKT